MRINLFNEDISKLTQKDLQDLEVCSLYDLLGVQPSASVYDVVKAFRELIFKYRPKKANNHSDIFGLLCDRFQSYLSELSPYPLHRLLSVDEQATPNEIEKAYLFLMNELLSVEYSDDNCASVDQFIKIVNEKLKKLAERLGKQPFTDYDQPLVESREKINEILLRDDVFNESDCPSAPFHIDGIVFEKALAQRKVKQFPLLPSDIATDKARHAEEVKSQSYVLINQDAIRMTVEYLLILENVFSLLKEKGILTKDNVYKLYFNLIDRPFGFDRGVQCLSEFYKAIKRLSEGDALDQKSFDEMIKVAGVKWIEKNGKSDSAVESYFLEQADKIYTTYQSVQQSYDQDSVNFIIQNSAVVKQFKYPCSFEGAGYFSRTAVDQGTEPPDLVYRECSDQSGANVTTGTEYQIKRFYGANGVTIHVTPAVDQKGCAQLHIVQFKSGKKTTDEVISPSDLGLGHSKSDPVNSARYVAAMAIQAIGLAADGLEITKENLKASPAIQRASHFNSMDDAKKGLENAYVKPLSKHPTPEEVIEHNIARIKYLESEYASRSSHKYREFHGHTVKGGYKTATRLTTKVAAFFNQAFSASEKEKAIDKITALLDSKILINLAKNNRAIDLSELAPAARQGELGKCISAIADAQKQIIARENKFSAKK